MKLNPKTLRVFIVSFIAAAAAAALFFFLLFLIEREVQKAGELEEALRQEVSEEQQFLSQSALLANTKKERKEIDSRYLTDDAIALFLGSIEELGEAADAVAEVDSVNVREAGDESSVTGTLYISLVVTGEWGNVFHYLTLLESMPLSLTVEKSLFSVSGRTEEDGSVWRGSFDIAVETLQ